MPQKATSRDAPIWIRGDARRRVWANAYNDASRMLCRMGGPRGPCYRPEPIAGRVVRDLFGSTDRRRKLSGPSRMPNPGGLVHLGGPILALYIANADGHIVIKRWGHTTGPTALWSRSLHPSNYRKGGAVVSFPNKSIPAPTTSAYSAPALLELYEEWHDGKIPWGVSKLRISKPPQLGRAYVCVATLYRSDKFTDDGTMENFIHVHDEGVLAKWGPRGIVVRGGRLALTAGGLVH